MKNVGQGDISQVSLKAYFFGAICPVGMFFVPTGQLAPKKHALRLTWEMSAWEMSPCLLFLKIESTRRNYVNAKATQEHILSYLKYARIHVRQTWKK